MRGKFQCLRRWTAITGILISLMLHIAPSADAEPVTVTIDFEWQIASGANSRTVVFSIIIDGDKYFFPHEDAADLRNWGQEHRAALVDSLGVWGCADKQRPYGPLSQVHWCARIVTKNGNKRLVDYLRIVKNQRVEWTEYQANFRFSFDLQGNVCTAELLNGKETYRDPTRVKEIAVSNVQRQKCY